MLLWNDYEGKTIANTYTLGQLLRPEGRSALFALTQGPGSPAVIRLTESINDETQLMANWKRASELQQENLVHIEGFGETTFEGTPLTYVVMESADANLADLLKERPLTQAEAMQVGGSLASALSTLHEHGLIHGSIDASQVVAVGETVKLRTDSVRPCAQHPDDATPEACQKLIQRDVHDFATLLLRALTFESTLKPGLKLPAPFSQIVINGISGAWGLNEISNALNPPVATTPPVAPVVTAAAEPAPGISASVSTASAPTASSDPLHYQRRIQTSTVRVHPHMKLWIALGAAAVIILAVLIRGISSSPHNTSAAEAAPAAVEPARKIVTQPAPHSVAPAPNAALAHASSPAATESRSSVAASSRLQAGWYVVAYTFNREADALRRAAAIARSNPALHPQVITPYGGKPYLVALGGPMTRPDAESIQRRAKASGLPRDTFVRNYKGD